MMFELFTSKRDCCGCGVCASVCPKQAISMKKDAVGFHYPSIDHSLCVSCGLCKKSCAFQRENSLYAPLQVYALARKNPDLLARSASGGLFSVLAERTLAGGGVVFGAAMEPEGDTLVTRHRMASSPEELALLRGSKYVQSSLGNTLHQAKQQLDSGKNVLFSGTPCQIAALYAYLKKDYDNLLTVDLVCHGVPSAQMFQDYLRVLEQEYGGRITEFQFRYKNHDWGKDARVYYRKADGTMESRIIPRYDSSYYSYFFQNLIIRDSCHNCSYAGKQHPADLTAADFWGFEEVHPELMERRKKLDPNAGLSALLVNTPKGAAVAAACLDQFYWADSTFEKVLVRNPRLASPNEPGASREAVLQLYAQKGYAAVERDFRRKKRNAAMRDRLHSYIARFVPKSIRAIVKQLLRR